MKLPSFPLRSLAICSSILAGVAAFASCSKEKVTLPAGEETATARNASSADGGDASDGTTRSIQGADGSGESETDADPRPEETETTEGGSAEDRPESDSVKPDKGGLERFLAATSDDERVATLRELARSEDASLRAVVRNALEADSPVVREEAIRASAGIEPADASELLTEVAREGTPEEAATAIEVARDMDVSLRVQVLCQALESKDAATRILAVEEFGDLRPKYDIQHVFPSLSDPDPGVAAAASKNLENLFGQAFSDTLEAESWWSENASNYDENLVRVATDLP